MATEPCSFYLCAIALMVLSLVPIGATTQPEAPPEKEGNPGVPGLLAEVASLEQELAVTQGQLQETESLLSATEAELTETQTSLSDTQATLALTQGELEETSEVLDATRADLVREQNRYRVPRTGQGDCWGALSLDSDDPHFNVPCEHTGQDGEHRAGLAPPLDRLIDNGDGTITDQFTQLAWLRRGDCADGLSWPQAVSLARRLSGMPTKSLCGLWDGTAQGVWRLPNARELMSLLDFGAVRSTGVALPVGHPFSGFLGHYWTSTTFAVEPALPVADRIWPCFRRGYGWNLLRFNDAYVVDLRGGALLHLPKEAGDDIARRHRSPDGLCTIEGFRNGSPTDEPYVLPAPRFMAVRDVIE